MPTSPYSNSSLSLSSLIPVDQSRPPSSLDQVNRLIRSNNKEMSIVSDIIRRLHQRLSDIENTLRDSTPILKSLSIDSADIGDLTISNEYGPGDLTILTGPPDYSTIGWIGTKVFGVTVTVTSSGSTWVTSSPHGLIEGDRFYAQGNANAGHNGFWKVLSITNETTFDIDNPPGGSGSGGTLEPVFTGAHFEKILLGGDVDNPYSAPFYTDNLGGTFIGRGGFISLVDSFEDEVGYLGVKYGPAITISGSADNGSGLVRITTSAPHGWRNGEEIILVNQDEKWIITYVDTTHVDLVGSTYPHAVGTLARANYAGVWADTLAASGTGFEDAKLRAMPNGDLLITDAIIDITGNDGIGDFHIAINGTSGMKIEDLTNNFYSQFASGGLSIISLDSENYKSFLNPTSFSMQNSGNIGFDLRWYGTFPNDYMLAGFNDHLGVSSITLNGDLGKGTFREVSTPLITGGALNDYYLKTQTYSQTEVDLLLLAYDSRITTLETNYTSILTALATLTSDYTSHYHSYSGSANLTTGNYSGNTSGPI